MTCKDPDLDQVEQVTEVGGMEVKVMNKLAIEGGGEGENRGCRQGGPTKLPAKGGGQQQRPGKEEPLVGRRKESEPACCATSPSCSTDPGHHSKERNRGAARRQLLLCNVWSMLGGPW